MKNRVKKLVKTILFCSIVVSSLAGCGTKSNQKANMNANYKVAFPLSESITLKCWVPSPSAGIINNFNEMGMYKELEKQTGVKIEFIHPVDVQVKEQFNIMIASRDFPDIIEGMGNYSGGLTKAFEDEVIIELNDLQKKYAPNLTAIYDEYPFLNPYIQNENEQYLAVPMIRGGAIVRQQAGPVFRADWLNELGFGIPETLDEWTTILRAFKEKKAIKSPFIATSAILKSNAIIGAFDISYGYFIDNGKVRFGPYDPRYKDYLTLMNQWYQEGLLDKEFATIDDKTIDSRILNNETGAYVGVLGSGLGKYLTLAKGKNEKFDLQPVPYPVSKQGQHEVIANVSDFVCRLDTSITTTSKYPEIAIAWLDYAFSKKGHLIYNFGVEGESYVMGDGQPKFTDMIVNNPDGKDMSTMGRMYARSFTGGPFVHDTRYGEQFWYMPRQKEAVNIWTKYSEEAVKAKTKYIGTLNADENAASVNRQIEIDTFKDEAFIKFVMGITPISEFDNYIAQIKKMGINDLISTRQNAYERFVNKYPNYEIPYDCDISKRYAK